ncbi:putative abc transporter c family member [Operophtera brumata]|uniref:Putative abc transporter c family member n=1 Tax=Operophtera brumata TaxID=104452 RepID=A0A0L7L6J0_OPEBR|nr:putative abc transporter c family member [Operophtera brumata]
MWFFHHNPSGHINRFSKDMGQVDTLLPVALVDCLGVSDAPMWIYHHNPSGHINRFSKDMGQVDTLLPVALVDCLGVSDAPMWIYHHNSSGHINRFSKDMGQVDTLLPVALVDSRSQSLNHLSSTVGGLTTIRSSRHQRLLAQEFDKLQDLHSSSWTLLLNTNRTRGHVPVWDETDRRGGESDDICKYSYRLVRYCSVGLAITQMIGLVGMCQYGMRQTAEVENQMTSVSTAIDSLDTVAWD